MCIVKGERYLTIKQQDPAHYTLQVQGLRHRKSSRSSVWSAFQADDISGDAIDPMN